MIDEATGEAFRWQPEVMIAPISDRLRQQFEPHDTEVEESPFHLRWIDEPNRGQADPEA